MTPKVVAGELAWFFLTWIVALSGSTVQGCFSIDPTVTVDKVEVTLPAECTAYVSVADGGREFLPELVSCGDAGD